MSPEKKREREKRAARRRGMLAVSPDGAALDSGPDPDDLDFARDMEDGLVLSAEQWRQAAADGVVFHTSRIAALRPSKATHRSHCSGV